MIAINGTDLFIQPDVRWLPRSVLGTDGQGHPIYSAIREVEMNFVLVDQATYNQLQGFYNLCGNTGTAVARLPQYGSSQFSFIDYSGCIVGEPEINGNYFTEDGYIPQIKQNIFNIRGT